MFNTGDSVLCAELLHIVYDGLHNYCLLVLRVIIYCILLHLSLYMLNLVSIYPVILGILCIDSLQFLWPIFHLLSFISNFLFGGTETELYYIYTGNGTIT